MFKDMTLGQYYPVDSWLHRLDPRVKLLNTMVYLASLFIAKNALGYILAAVYLFVLIALSRIPLGYMLRGLKGILFLLLLSVAINVFFTPGEVVFSFWIFKITREGLRMALKLGVRLTLLLMGSSLMTYTTTPTDLTAGLEKGLHFLTVFKVPVHEVAMMMSIALRFLPVLTEELDKIRKAQMARGADFESGNLIARTKALIPVLIPLFVSAFRRAGDLATAMEARCYHGGEGRTKMKPLRYGAADTFFFFVMAAYLVIIIFTRQVTL